MKYSAQQFSNDAGISVKLAKRVIDILDEKELSPEDLNTVLWKLRDFIMKNQMPTLMDKAKDEDITAIIDQIIVERAMYRRQCGPEVAYAKNAEELSRAFAGKPSTAWFFSEMPEKKSGYAAGDIVTIQIFRVGKWNHSEYGEVEITKKTIKDVVKNFEENVRGVQICVDENHEPDHKALGWYKEITAEDGGDACFAKIELTKKGADLLNEGAYKYFSPEICFYKVDEETGKTLKNLLIGGAFTNRPFFKGMKPLMATEGAAPDGKTGAYAASQRAYFFSPLASMHKFLMLLDKLSAKETITASEKAELEMRYNELPEADRSAEVQKVFAEAIAMFDEEGDGAPAAPAPAAAPEAEKPKEGEGEGEGVAPAAEGEAPAEGVAPEGVAGEVQANEDGSFRVDATFMENVKGMQQTLSKMSSVAVFNDCQTKVQKMCFSDKQPTNVVTPKHVPKMAKFAAGLSEAARKEFFEIIGSLKAVPAGEKGHGKDVTAATGNFNDPASIPADDEKVKYFMEDMKQSLGDAQKSAAHYYRSKAEKKA